MTVELTMLAWTLALALVQVFLFAIVRTRQYGSKWNIGARDDAMPPLGPLAGRLKRAQDNLFETLPLFIGAVLTAHIAGRDNTMTAIGAQTYFWGRVIYVPLYAAGIPVIRTLVWMVGTAGLVTIVCGLLVPH